MTDNALRGLAAALFGRDDAPAAPATPPPAAAPATPPTASAPREGTASGTPPRGSGDVADFITDLFLH